MCNSSGVTFFSGCNYTGTASTPIPVGFFPFGALPKGIPSNFPVNAVNSMKVGNALLDCSLFYEGKRFIAPIGRHSQIPSGMSVELYGSGSFGSSAYLNVSGAGGSCLSGVSGGGVSNWSSVTQAIIVKGPNMFHAGEECM